MDEELRSLRERTEILDTVNDLFVGTDDRDWKRVARALAPRVEFDMKSVTGEEPSIVDSGKIIAGWEEGLRPLQAVHHQTGNFRVRLEADQADVFCYGIALHYRPNASGRNTRRFVGSYDLHLRKEAGGWRIDRFRFNLKFIDGNLELEKGG